MLGARWYKVLYDLWGNKTRTALIVLSITAGLFAIGMIVNTRVIMSEEMDRGYAAINPSHGTVQTIEPFDQDFVESVRRIDGVAEADGRAHLAVRFQVRRDGTSGPSSPSRWRDLQLFAVPDYEDVRVNKIRPQSGAWPPPPRELLIERSALDLVGAQVGDWVLIETPGQEPRELRVAGVVHDLAQMPAIFNNMPYGYVSFDTLPWLGEPRGLNELHIVVQNPDDEQALGRVVNQVKDRVEAQGYTIPMSVMAAPGEFPLEDYLQAVLLFLGALGSLSLFLSAFLIINTVSALVAQQIRQIGIIKAVGARASQVVGMYLALVLSYAVIALLLAVPLGVAGARALSGLLAGFFNFDLSGFRVAPQAIGLQIAIGLLAPVLAALYPLLTALRVSAAEAMSNYGMSRDQFGTGRLDRLLTGRSAWVQRALSRPLMLSLRNTFRRKGRLALTLMTLTLGGAMFIGIFSVNASLSRTLRDVTQTHRSDVWVNFAQPQRVAWVEERALEVPGVARAKGWTRMLVRRVRADGDQSENLILIAPQVASDLVHPTMLEGRWLCPGDERALVISTGVLTREPDVAVGDEVTIKIQGRETDFRVVGLALGLGVAPWTYASLDAVAAITQDAGWTRGLMVVTEDHDPSAPAQTATALEAHLREAGVPVDGVQLVAEESAGAEIGFNVVIALALVMAVLLAVVGGLGLMGTLSINVLERTREIGVMRAVGAADGAVARVFVVEGALIGVLSWLFGALAAIPLSRVLSDAIGTAFLQAPLSYSFSAGGALLWLAAGVLLSAVASFVPARNASRLTVREVLAYE